MKHIKILLLIVCSLLVISCSSSPPRNLSQINHVYTTDTQRDFELNGIKFFNSILIDYHGGSRTNIRKGSTAAGKIGIYLNNDLAFELKVTDLDCLIVCLGQPNPAIAELGFIQLPPGRHYITVYGAQSLYTSSLSIMKREVPDSKILFESYIDVKKGEVPAFRAHVERHKTDTRWVFSTHFQGDVKANYVP